MESLRIGIVTFWSSSENFGQLLQAYALQEFLCRQGHDAHLIRYDRVVDNAVVRARKNATAKRSMADLYRYLKRLAKQLLVTASEPTAFERFRAARIRFGSEQYRLAGDLRASPPQVDVLICGSDQIWNPAFVESPEPFFLAFGDPQIFRLSYAASFGRPDLPDLVKRRYRDLMTHLDLVSVREESGLDICRELGRPDAVLMPDPTFLLPASEWRHLASTVDNTATGTLRIFAYVLDGRPLEAREPLMRYLQSRSGTVLSSCVVANNATGRAAEGLAQWLGSVDSSEVVVTNSFHAVVFSVLFNKKFIALLVDGRDAGMNERITGLLGRLGLSDRVLRRFDPTEVEALLHKDPPWNRINDTLDEWRELGMDFLNFEKYQNRLRSRK